MSDLATRPGAEDASTIDSAITEVESTNGDRDEPTYAWAPAEPAPRKRRLGLWIGIPAGIAVVGLVASSLVLIAPGTTVAGVSLGGLTVGAAADALQHRLDETTVVLTGAGAGAAVTGAELGAKLDVHDLAETAFAEHPMWNPTSWFSSPTHAEVTLDADAATAALRDAAPSLYVAPVDATLGFDAASASYVVTPAVDGAGIDVASIETALDGALAAGKTHVEVAAQSAPVAARTTTEVAQNAATTLNGMLDNVGFYVGTERTVPVDRTVAASWLTLSTDAKSGAITWKTDAASIQKAVDALPATINRDAVNATDITDSDGKVLEEQTAGVSGRALGAITGLGAAFAAQMSGGTAAFALPVTETPFTTTSLARRIEVDISEQTEYLFENGAVVQTYLISSGLYGHDTDLGHFRIYAKLPIQDMGDPNLIKADYFTPNVPWVSYYNGDEALHGAYWHNNFGNRMSHGCVNMPVEAAHYVFDWAPIGTEVWVHD